MAPRPAGAARTRSTRSACRAEFQANAVRLGVLGLFVILLILVVIVSLLGLNDYVMLLVSFTMRSDTETFEGRLMNFWIRDDPEDVPVNGENSCFIVW